MELPVFTDNIVSGNNLLAINFASVGAAYYYIAIPPGTYTSAEDIVTAINNSIVLLASGEGTPDLVLGIEDNRLVVVSTTETTTVTISEITANLMTSIPTTSISVEYGASDEYTVLYNSPPSSLNALSLDGTVSINRTVDLPTGGTDTYFENIIFEPSGILHMLGFGNNTFVFDVATTTSTEPSYLPILNWDKHIVARRMNIDNQKILRMIIADRPQLEESASVIFEPHEYAEFYERQEIITGDNFIGTQSYLATRVNLPDIYNYLLVRALELSPQPL